MGVIPFDKFNLNRFWEKTPTPLKYILVFAILVAVSYFVFSKKIYDSQTHELERIEVSIDATYRLMDSFEEFRVEQDKYNKEILSYLNNLHSLVQELNYTTNRKIDMILKSGNQNADVIVEKILLLNESFEKLTKAYTPDIEKPNLDDNKVERDREYYERNIKAVPIKDKRLIERELEIQARPDTTGK